ncbi:MAG: hypothetical protein ACNA78_05015 [Balneolaceae bacterium]
MLARLIYLNWKLFLASLTRLQTVLLIGYSLFLVGMFINLMGTALVVLFLDSTAQLQIELPWLTPEIHRIIIIVFANLFWLMHFSFTSTRLLNVEENRKLMAFGYPARTLSWHLNIMSLYHPVNVIYNLTWLVFLGVQVQSGWNIPLVVLAVLLNYAIIFSIKQRFLRLMERRLRLVVVSGVFVFLGVATVVAVLTRNTQAIVEQLALQLEQIVGAMLWLPGGLLLQSASASMAAGAATSLSVILGVLLWFFLHDHYRCTLSGLQNPSFKKAGRDVSHFWQWLKRLMGPNAGKYIYYVAIHPYNRLQIIAVLIIPAVYIPILLYFDFGVITQILVPTMLAAIPVALLAMGMANMFGYEHREMLLHVQLPEPLEKQLKERFFGVITIPLFIFYAITILELLYLPQFGSVFAIYIANTFFFVCFMLFFLWSSFYQYETARFSTFSYKHPIIAQKVTFSISMLIFVLGYTVFVPLGEFEIYRTWTMAALVGAITIYIWRNTDLLAAGFRKRILKQLWNDY